MCYEINRKHDGVWCGGCVGHRHPGTLKSDVFLMESGGENGAARRVFPRNASEFLVLRHKLENFINEPHSSTCAPVPLTHLRGDRHGGRRERELRPGGRAAVPERLSRSREEGRQKSTRGPADPPGARSQSRPHRGSARTKVRSRRSRPPVE